VEGEWKLNVRGPALTSIDGSHLSVNHAGIQAILVHQRVMVAFLCDNAALHHGNGRGVLDGCQPAYSLRDNYSAINSQHSRVQNTSGCESPLMALAM
jgi:hypothetical protein